MKAIRWPTSSALLSAPRLRSLTIGMMVVASLAVLLRALDAMYPIADWLVWTLLALWAWQLLLGAAFLSCGHFLLTRVLRIRAASWLELVTLAVTTGAVVFGTGMFVAGYLALYGAIFAVLWPLMMLLAGLPAAIPVVLRLVAQRRQPRLPTGPIAIAALTFGGFGLAVVYLGVLSPDSLNYDALWSHVVIAQDYAREGRIVPFRGDWPKNLPHLGSIFNTWGFLVPGFREPAVRWMMALHTEFAFFVWTLVGVWAAIRWMIGRDVRAGWVALFLFPGIFVSDSNLGAAADHFLAFFAVPMFLAVMGTIRTMQLRWWALLGIVFAGALLTKFQAAYLVLPMAIMLTGAFMRAAWRATVRKTEASPSMRLLWGPAVALGCVIVVTAPHFLKNWIYYHNPFFPLAQRTFTASSPTFPGAPSLVDNILHHFGAHPPHDLLPRLKAALGILLTFAIRPHTESNAHCPCFGLLFVFCIALFPLLPNARRIRVGVLVAVGCLLTWAMTYWVVRNMQAFLPLLAAVTGAVLIRAWEVGRVARVGVAALVAIQIAWGADFMFAGTDYMQSAVALIRSGTTGKGRTRFANYRRDYVELGRSLPKDSLVLLHGIHMNLGINRRTISDNLGFQGLIDHRRFGTPRQFYDRLKALGVTHVVYEQQGPAPTKQEEVIFGAFVVRFGAGVRTFGNMRLMAMPAERPPEEAPYQALVVGVNGYADGLYRVEDLATWERMPENLRVRYSPLVAIGPDGTAAALLTTAQAVLLGGGAKLDPSTQDGLGRDFSRFAGYAGLTVDIRTRPQVPAKSAPLPGT